MSNMICYSVIIYTILFIIILQKKNSLIYDNNKIKSWNFFCDKISKINKLKSIDDLISFPVIVIILVGISSYISKYIN